MHRTALGHGLRTGVIAALLGLGLTAANTAMAASSVLIWPINPTIEAEQKAAALWLENRGQQPVDLQVRVMTWRQGNFDDQLDAQRTIIGSPPVVTIAPGKRQMIRLIATQPAPAGTEQAYRVLVDEMLRPDAQVDPQLGVKFQMRYSVPLFVFGGGAGPEPVSGAKPREGVQILQPRLSYQVRQEGGRRYLFLSNQGPAHARLSKVSLRQGDASTLIADGLLGYVLPGAQMRWQLPERAPSGNFVLEARINEQAEPQPIPAH
ncbi:fimbrial biogenesis chaperone [Pseudomonas solani]|uniref:fimbrial biogenesis chaperone n=1 Tax=Pseudomonas solani TaxID=2731552 RepID=UPI003C2B9A33